MKTSLGSYLPLIEESPGFSNQVQKFQPLEDWSGLIQSSNSNYSGVYVFARKHAASIVVLNSKNVFCFNVTYFRQLQKTFQNFLETMREFVKDLNQSIVYFVLPYEEMHKGTKEELNKLVSANFSLVRIENILLSKNQRLTIHRDKGNILHEDIPETSFKNVSRRIKKVSSILFSRENTITFAC